MLLTSNLWIKWAHIAIKNEAETRAHRRDAIARWPGDAGQPLNDEMEASMVAITAVAFALEALHGDLAQLLEREPDTRLVKGTKWRYVFRTLELASPAVVRYRDQFSSLQRLRGSAVHFVSKPLTPVPHPELPTSISPENVAFSLEAASWEIDMLMGILDLVTAGLGDLRIVKWAVAHRSGALHLPTTRST